MNPNPYQQTRFLLGTPDPRHAPPDRGAEVAFAGRSNSGKSSALNTITGQRALARSSKEPGRTREINFFQVRDDRRLVDLPGYGYAKVSRSVQQRWERYLSRYLETRASLAGLVVMMDVRHPLKAFDRQLLGWCRAANLPVHVLLTKADKLKHGPARSTLLTVEQEVTRLHPGGSVQLFSSLQGTGAEEAREKLNQWLGLP